MRYSKNSLMASTVAACVLASAWSSGAAERSSLPPGSSLDIRPTPNADGNYNILFLVTDQERYMDNYPAGTAYEARKLLAELGTTFEKHYNCATMSTSSRSVMYTGQHIPHTKMIDNTDFEWQGPLSPQMTTVGDLMRDAGYYSAYKGKWHMANASTLQDVEDELTDLGEYGFADWNVSGDYIGKMWEGYEKDPEIVSHAVQWLQTTGMGKNREGKSFFLPVNLINPHDVMYYNTDPTFRGPIPVGGAPNDPVYQKSYDVPIAASWNQNLSDGTLPAALALNKKFMERQTGAITTAEGWKSYQDYYFNCIQDSDDNLKNILQALIDLGMLNNTIVVFTADHGEMAGSHGMKSKGSYMYEENIHVPLMIYHPEVKGGQRVRSVTSHIDLVPTFVHMARLSDEKRAAILGKLPGGNLLPLLRGVATSIREGALFCAELISLTMAQGHMTPSGKIYYSFDTNVRGMVRAVITERYKFARYFSTDFNTPQSLEELLRRNDIELYDLVNDPGELRNLAHDPEANQQLILELNALLNTLISREIGADNGTEVTDAINSYLAQFARSGGNLSGCHTGVSAAETVLLLLPLLGLVRRK